MSTKSLLAGVAGGVVLFLLGWVFYMLLLRGFFEANLGSASGVWRDPPAVLLIVLGEVVWGVLLAVIYSRWAGISTFAGGAEAGALFGLLAGLAIGLIMYGASNVYTLTAYLVDAVGYAVRFAVAGGVIGVVLGRGSSSD